MIPNLPSHHTMVRNIRRAYAMADATERDHGASWYPQVLDIATTLATLHHVDTVTAAGIVAAMSPMTGWAENVKRATAFLGGHPVGHLANIMGKCEAIRGGAQPLDVLRGAKVRAFFACIMGSTSTVCVDRHAVDIALGRVTDDATRKVLERKGNYDRVAAAYVAAARGLGIVPSACQATTWIAWRRVHDRSWYSVGTKKGDAA